MQFLVESARSYRVRKKRYQCIFHQLESLPASFLPSTAPSGKIRLSSTILPISRSSSTQLEKSFERICRTDRTGRSIESSIGAELVFSIADSLDAFLELRASADSPVSSQKSQPRVEPESLYRCHKHRQFGYVCTQRHQYPCHWFLGCPSLA